MSAVLSPDGMYRYWLSRGADRSDRTVAFVGINPSTADATEDDPTIRKMCGFARVWRFDRVVVVNIFALRSPNVFTLDRVEDPIGNPENNQYIRAALVEAAVVVPCWGRIEKIPLRLRFRAMEVREMLCACSLPLLQCLGFTKGGDPLHPLMLSYETPLVRWP